LTEKFSQTRIAGIKGDTGIEYLGRKWNDPILRSYP
jgi:hypothetical protein